MTLPRAPVWAPPPMPAYAEFKAGFGEAERFPDSGNFAASCERVLNCEAMATEGLLWLWLWLVTALFGVLYLAKRGERRDRVLHCVLSAGIGLTVAAAVSVGLWLIYGGWGPPAPLFFGGIGLVVGLVMGLATAERGGPPFTGPVR